MTPGALPRRWLWLGGLLLVSLVLAWNSPPPLPEEAAVQPRARSNGATAGAAAAPAEAYSLAPRAVPRQEAVDLFAPVPVAVAEAPPPEAFVAAPPSAPPLPFSFVGSMQEAGQRVVFLQHGERVYDARAGASVGPDYRLLGIANGQLTLLYLPLNITQTMYVGSRLE